jgi:hypothetical protein
VHRSQRLRRLPFVDDHGNVAFGRSLGDRADIDARCAERSEDLRRHARRPGHAVADDGQYAAAAYDVHVLDLASVQLRVKCMADRSRSALGF